MILSVCVSPCIDVTTYTDEQGNPIQQPVIACGGKAINVAVGVKRLGGTPLLLSVMFSENDDTFQRYLQSEGVESNFVVEEGAVRVNEKLYNGETLIERNAPATAISTNTANALLQCIRKLSKNSEVTVISGSLPKNVSPSFYQEMAEAVDERSRLIIDATGENLLQALNANRAIDFIKPNLHELEQTTHCQIIDVKTLKKACQTLISAGAKHVLASLGAQGAVITDGARYYHANSTQKACNATVGAGDSLVSAIALEMTKTHSLPQLLQAGVAAGAAKVSNQFTLDGYQKIYSEIVVKEI